MGPTLQGMTRLPQRTSSPIKRGLALLCTMGGDLSRFCFHVLPPCSAFDMRLLL